MRIGTKIFLLVAVLVCGVWIATRDGDSKSEQQQAAAIEEGHTFRLTGLTKTPYYLQHGIETFITLNMIENGGVDAVRVDDPPPFPLIATLEYQTVDGQKRKVSSSYGYRC